jgi:hypothetical protein
MIEDDGFVENKDRSTEELKGLIRRYERSVVEYKGHELLGHWYTVDGQWYRNERELREAGYVPYVRGEGQFRTAYKYEAAEDLIFLYTELAECYTIVFDRQQEQLQREGK